MFKVDELLYRGPRPTSFADLQKLGFQRVISLQSGFENSVTETQYEYEEASDFGLDFWNLKWSNFWPPSHAQINQALDLLETGLKTYVHCHSGVDRTGAFVLGYRRRKGVPFKVAYAEFIRMGRHPWFFWWKPFLHRSTA